MIRFVSYPALLLALSGFIFLGPAHAEDYPALDVHTPNGSMVPCAWVRDEAPYDSIQTWNVDVEFLIAFSGWDAEILKESTLTYNCHGYAWHASEGGDPVWIGMGKAEYCSTYNEVIVAEDIYWEDGSYFEVDGVNPETVTVFSAGGPRKANFPNGNHSAITTAIPGYLVSKWGKGPLVRHRWNHCPYDQTDIKFYRPDNPAAVVHGFAVVDGVAQWKVSSEHRTSHYRIDGSYTLAGPWNSLTPPLSPGAGFHHVEIGGGHEWFRLVEVEANGQEIFHGAATHTNQVTHNVEPRPTIEFLRDRIDCLRQSRLNNGYLSSIPQLGRDETVVIFCPLKFREALEYTYAEFWGGYGYSVMIEEIDDYPADPGSFRAHLKGEIASWAASGARFFLLVGDANDWQWFDLAEQGGQYWTGDWLSIHNGYLASGYSERGQPAKDIIPTFAVSDTASRGLNTAYVTPYWMTDQPYQDIDNDEMPDVVLARLPFNNVEDVWAFGHKLEMNQFFDSGSHGAQSVGFFVGDLDHDGLGDGQCARDAAQQVEGELPGGLWIQHLYESDIPSGGARNEAAADHWNLYRPELLLMLSSYSNRSWPANFFDQTNAANPWDMGMLDPYGTHAALVLSGSCDGADFARTEDPDYGAPIAEKFLASWDKGAMAWVGPTTGSWQPTNAVFAKYFVQELYADPDRPAAESFLVAVQRLLEEFPDRLDVRHTARSYVFLGDPLARINKMNSVTGVGDVLGPDQGYALHQNKPNPFAANTKISFVLAAKSDVEIDIYSVAGHCVRSLAHRSFPAGPHILEWDGRNNAALQAGSGVYFCRLSAQNRRVTRKMLLLR